MSIEISKRRTRCMKYILQYLLYYNSEVFKEYVLGFGVTGYAFAAGLADRKYKNLPYRVKIKTT